MSDTFLQKTHEIIASLQRRAANGSKPSDPVDINTYISQFYSYVPVEELQGLDNDALHAIAENSLKFLSQRKPGEIKVRVYDTSSEPYGWKSDYTIIEILNDDMPFLVDSVTEELNQRGCRIASIIHPVIRVSRDKGGNITALLPADTPKQEGVLQESVMHLQISHIADETARRELQKDLLNVLKMVRLAVEDWKKMVAKVNDTIEEITHSDYLIAVAAKRSTSHPPEADDMDEVAEFLRWLKSDNFVILGYVEYNFLDTSGKEQIQVVPGSELGILRADDPELKPQGLTALSSETLHFARNAHPVEVTKSNRKSVIHRPAHMDYIRVKRFDKQGNVVGEHSFLGLFTSTVYYQSAQHIPIIRKKMKKVEERAAFSKSGHSNKALVAALEAFPRDELFQISEEDLFQTAMGIVTLATRPRVRLFIRRDTFGRFVSCIVFLPRARLSTQLREEMQEILCEAFHGSVADHYMQITDSPLARLQIVIKIEGGEIPPFDVLEIETKLAKAATFWVDELRDMLINNKGELEGERLLHKYANAFTAGYSGRFSAQAAYRDVEKVEHVIKTGEISFDLYESAFDEDHIMQLKIYSPDIQLHLADIMPMLENMGIHAVDGQTLRVTPVHHDHVIWLHHFRFALPKGMRKPDVKDIKENFETALSKLWSYDIEDDNFNKLILVAGLHWREVVLLRAYSKYLRQVGFTYSHQYIAEALTKHSTIAYNLVKLFKIKFDPDYEGDRSQKIASLKQEMDTQLNEVSNLAEDRVIRCFIALNDAMLRTNYYQPDAEGKVKNYISFKFDSALVPDLPLPRPFAEIFVYSPRVEGIHLRGGKVARGGLRWSDRHEDFRTEVLGLMKAQMTKNAVIVPVGSKGGFVLKMPPSEGGRDALLQEGINCYKTFLRGLLDITDNLVNNAAVTPKNVVRYDGDDPYLVVAADKGTATFSDIANGISEEYHFWLGDAFASGGSAGYDHKKMGITARGGWVSVQRHFRDMGRDIQKEDFTVIGIGDMSGDVFGNGMLLSEHIKLVGAFNHMHIFLDPNPDTAKSFNERKRLFDLPRSTWKDYAAELISKGGGVFERSAKAIPLSPEIKAILDVKDDQLSPDALIRAMMLAPVDLIWNGGIGTYVKSSMETNAVVGDRTNDNLRVNGNELRCKVMGEGGNLGFTQLGRVEYAFKGGRINTDAIDNSAGVDCSDHEVNIKIALGKAVETKKLSVKDRDVLLAEMTDEVAKLVLRDNQLQTQAITIAEKQGVTIIELQQQLMHSLEKEGLLHRKIEFLPDDEAIARRTTEGKGLTRPEIAVLLAYSKMSVYNDLLASNLPDDNYFLNDLMLYFPKRMREEFLQEIEGHPLRREIIATFTTNSMVNRVGPSFLNHVSEDTGMKGCDVARAYALTRDIFNLRALWLEIEALDGKIDIDIQIQLFLDIQQLIERTVFWFLRNYPQPLAIADTLTLFTKGVGELASSLAEVIPEGSLEDQAFKRKQQQYVEAGVPEALAKKIAGLDIMASACDIVQVANEHGLPTHIVGKIYFEMGRRLYISWIRSNIRKVPKDSYWQRLSCKTLVDDLFDQQRRLTSEGIKVLCKGDSCDLVIERWLAANQKHIARYDSFIEDLKTSDAVNFPMLVVATKRVEAICSV